MQIIQEPYLRGPGQAALGDPAWAEVGPDNPPESLQPQAFCAVYLQGLQWYQWAALYYTSWCGFFSLSLGVAYETVEVMMSDKKIGSLLD